MAGDLPSIDGYPNQTNDNTGPTRNGDGTVKVSSSSTKAPQSSRSRHRAKHAAINPDQGDLPEERKNVKERSVSSPKQRCCPEEKANFDQKSASSLPEQRDCPKGEASVNEKRAPSIPKQQKVSERKFSRNVPPIISTIWNWPVAALRKSFTVLRRLISCIFVLVSIPWRGLVAVVRKSFNVLKAPIFHILILLVVLVIFVISQELAGLIIATACSTSAVASSSFCLPKLPRGPPDFDGLVSIQEKLNDVQAVSTNGVTLPWTLTKDRMSVRDMAVVVSVSGLPSREEMSWSFAKFVLISRNATDNLRRFISHVDRLVSLTIIINNQFSRALDDVATETTPESDYLGNVLRKVLALLFRDTESTEEAVQRLYIEHTVEVRDEVNQLINEGASVSRELDHLQDTLDDIGRLAKADSNVIGVSENRMMSSYLAILGGSAHRERLYQVDQWLYILDDVARSRQEAYGILGLTLEALGVMRDELESLKDSANAPAMFRKEFAPVPLHTQIEMVRRGVERLKLGREEYQKKKAELVADIMDRSRKANVKRIEM